MPFSRAALLVALSIAYAGVRGFAEDAPRPAPNPVTSQPVEEPRLKEVLRDDFQTDTRKNYDVKGDVAWEKGRLTVSANSSIRVNLESGPWTQWQLELDWPPLKKDGDESSAMLLIRLQGGNNTGVGVRWSWVRQDGQASGHVQILDADTKVGQSRFRIVREFPVPKVAGPWKIRYRYGVISIDKGTQSVGLGHTPEKGAAFPIFWNVYAEQSIDVHSILVQASPKIPDGTPHTSKALLEAKNLIQSALSLYHQGKYAQAEPLYLRACDVYKRELGEEHPHYGNSLNHLALLYESMNEFTKAEPLQLQACNIFKDKLGEEHRYAVSLNNLALLYKSMGAFAKAEPLFEQSREIRKRVLGEDHPDYAASLSNLAGLYRSMGSYAKAEPLCAAACDIYKRVLGERHPEYAVSLNVQAMLYHSMADYARAELLYREACDIRKLARGETHPDYATSLNNLAALYQSMGDEAKAEPLYIQARDIWKQTVGESHPLYAGSLARLASVYASTGEFAKAESLYVEALEIRRRALGEMHPDFAESLNNLAILHISMAEYAKAEPLLMQARDICKQMLGDKHPTYAVSLHNLALLYKSTGEYARAEPLYVQARDIARDALGEEHSQYANNLCNLAALYDLMGEYAKAEPLYLQAREIQQRLLGKEHPNHVQTLNNLAGHYRNMGQYARAEPLMVQALSLRRQKLGEGHLDYAESLNSLAALYMSIARYDKAEPLFRQTLDIRRKKLGEAHPNYAESLNNLAVLYEATGRHASAEELQVQACDIRKQVLGDSHPLYANSLGNLAGLYASMGQYAKAESLYVQGLDVWRRSLGTEHPHYVRALISLAFLHASAGDYAKSESQFQSAVAVQIQIAQRSLSGLPESSSQEFVDAHLNGLAGFLFACRQIDDYPSQSAYAAVWSSQGLVSRTLRERRRAFGNDPEAARLSAQLRTTQQQLAQWTLLTPSPSQQKQRASRLQELDDEKERLETALAKVSGTFKLSTELERHNPDDLMRVLPSATAIVHFLKIPVWEPPAGGKGLGEAAEHYEAFVLANSDTTDSKPNSAGRPIAWVHLGPADSIDSALVQWREQVQQSGGRGVGGVTNPRGEATTSPADALRKGIWSKIEPHLVGCKSLIVIPDGDLHFLPWGALPGNAPGTFLIEEYSIATAQDGRQLYQTLSSPPVTSKQSLLLVGGVDYDQGDARPTAPPPVIEITANATSNGKRSRPPSQAKRPVWQALAGTAIETGQVTKLAGMRKAKLLRGSEAQENALRQEMPQARFIHLATHGFFADESFRSAFQQDEAGEQLFGGAKNLVTKKQAGVTYRNPLLLSGIVLAGANQPPQIDTLGLETGQDGILTAEEVVNLDLQQTELVVLSACDTGLGRVGGGEGVFGLQRAFALAGARTTIASLWKVDDAATQALMAEFYRNLWEKKLPKLEALRQAQLTMLRRYDPKTKQLRSPSQAARPQSTETASKSEALSPFYWAAFTLSGDCR